MATRLWDVQARLVAIFDGATGRDVKVFPGPRGRSEEPKKFVLVGTDGGESGTEPASDGLTATQSASSLGPGTWRDETGSVTCAAWCWSGSPSIDAVRTATREILVACEQAVEADRSLGGLLVPPGLAELTAHSVRESQRPSGPLVRVVFTVSYGALITPAEGEPA